eukprot:7420039-Prorocentrum_lima.AAC.1
MYAIACGLDPDAASDAQLASKMLHWSWLPKAIIFRDKKTHGCRRVLTGPWRADPQLAKVVSIL